MTGNTDGRTTVGRPNPDAGVPVGAKQCWAKVKVFAPVTVAGTNERTYSTTPEEVVIWRTCVCSKENPCFQEGWTWDIETSDKTRLVFFGEKCFFEHAPCPDVPCTNVMRVADDLWDPGGTFGPSGSTKNLATMVNNLEYSAEQFYDELIDYYEIHCKPDDA